MDINKELKISQNHKEWLNKIKISLRFPEDASITIDIDSSFSNGDLEILSLQISRNKYKHRLMG